MFRKVIMFSLLLVFVVVSCVNSSYAELTIDPSGNVGIGATSPGAKLQIGDSLGNFTDNRISIGGSSGLQGMTFGKDVNNRSWVLRQITDGKTYIGEMHGGTLYNSLTLDTGNVGIGTTNPDATFKLHVNEGGAAAGHVARFSSSAESTYVSLSNTAPGGGSWYFRSKNTGNFAIHQPGVADRLIVTSSGNVGIGTSSPGYKLHVNGTAAGTSWTNLSSREYKDNIKKVDSSKHSEMLAQLMDIDLATYNYKQEYSDDNTKKIGFIAEDMPKEVLSIDGKGVDVYELLTYTIGAMKAQQETVMTIKEEIKTLKEENEQLRNALTSLTDRQKTVESMLLAMSSNLPKEKLVMK